MILKNDLIKVIDSTSEYKTFLGKYYGQKRYFRLYNNNSFKLYTLKNKLLIEGELSDSSYRYIKNGNWTYYDIKGKLAIKGSFINDSPINQWTYYYKNGKELKKEFYILTNRDTIINDTLQVYFIDHSARSGEYYEYYKTGQKKIEGQYKIQPGYCYSFIKNLNSKEEKPSFVVGKISMKDGKWTEFKKNGEIKDLRVIVTGGLHYDYEKQP